MKKLFAIMLASVFVAGPVFAQAEESAAEPKKQGLIEELLSGLCHPKKDNQQ